MKIDIQNLKEKAQAASQGEWKYITVVTPDEDLLQDRAIPGERYYHLSVITEDGMDRPLGIMMGDNAVWLKEYEGQNAEYVVTASPSNILELIAYIEDLEQEKQVAVDASWEKKWN